MDAVRLSSEHQGGVVIVAVQGDLDIVTSPKFDAYLSEARRSSAHIVIDLAGVNFMDTSSLAVIVGHWKKLMAQGGSLALAAARYRYTKTLWITGLAHRLPMFETVEEAVKAAAAAAASNGSGDALSRPDEEQGGRRDGERRAGRRRSQRTRIASKQASSPVSDAAIRSNSSA